MCPGDIDAPLALLQKGISQTKPKIAYIYVQRAITLWSNGMICIILDLEEVILKLSIMCQNFKKFHLKLFDLGTGHCKKKTKFQD